MKSLGTDDDDNPKAKNFTGRRKKSAKSGDKEELFYNVDKKGNVKVEKKAKRTKNNNQRFAQEMQQEREENKTANDMEKNVKTRWFDYSPIFAQS